MNKNWNDRADKDLFFTILSIKNIGVISGSEWTAIGNHMRTLGYGFTNEGCRQHFQGLRRAQNKIEGSVASPVDSGVRKIGDPTLNPITRRPGPGRGRPKKQASVPLGGATGPTASPVQQPLPPVPPIVSLPPQTESATPGSESLVVDPSLEDSDEQPAKRPRLEETQEPSLEDEAVLNALAAHNNPNAVDHYAPDFTYGEA
ncbi:hypothetical protein BR93DRAFT_928093 [Coniochaeta sp. PMI_546]|nr:hypothetical protein BR93DRAFT_928093 [Coniochaeta sp. PMI_546]